MQKTLSIQVDKIRISRCVSGSHADSFVDDPLEIKKILRLVEGKSERYPYFIDSPQLTTRFRIELYSGQKVVERITLVEDFLRRDNKWYRMADSSLKEEFVRQTAGALVAKIGVCTFGKPPRQRTKTNRRA